MSDIFNKAKRSEIMKKVRSKNNKSTELKLIQIFKENNIHGWRRNYKVKGHPDFVFLNKKIAIFVDGCFWHGHNCRNTKPKDNQEYWDKKRERNMKHDKEITEYFENRGWTVIRIWECELKKDNKNKSIETSGITKNYKEALCEFIWNSFEANATEVTISYSQNDVYGVYKRLALQIMEMVLFMLILPIHLELF